MVVEYYVMISDMSTGPRRRPQSCSRTRGMSGHSFSGSSNPVYVSDSIITFHSRGFCLYHKNNVERALTHFQQVNPATSPRLFLFETSSLRSCNNPKATNEHRHCCSSRSSSRRRRRLPSRRPTRPDWKTLRESIQRPSLLIPGMYM